MAYTTTIHYGSSSHSRYDRTHDKGETLTTEDPSANDPVTQDDEDQASVAADDEANADDSDDADDDAEDDASE